METYLVEITQQQNLRVSVPADSPQQAIALVHEQQGEVVMELPPELVTAASKIITTE